MIKCCRFDICTAQIIIVINLKAFFNLVLMKTDRLEDLVAER